MHDCKSSGEKYYKNDLQNKSIHISLKFKNLIFNVQKYSCNKYKIDRAKKFLPIFFGIYYNYYVSPKSKTMQIFPRNQLMKLMKDRCVAIMSKLRIDHPT